jgi:hypothetical protein
MERSKWKDIVFDANVQEKESIYVVDVIWK